jgi:hypothetical protein
MRAIVIACALALSGCAVDSFDVEMQKMRLKLAKGPGIGAKSSPPSPICAMCFSAGHRRYPPTS